MEVNTLLRLSKNYVTVLEFIASLPLHIHPNKMGFRKEKNRTILERTRSKMIAGGVEDFLWARLQKMQCISSTEPPRDQTLSLHLMKFSMGLNLIFSISKSFGCQVYVHVPESQRNKLQPRAIEGRFVGYDDSSKNFRVYMPPSNKVIVTRDVVFNESLRQN